MREVQAWMGERGETCALDESLVYKWEAGHVRTPHVRYRAALRAVLDVGDDGSLGFAHSQTDLDSAMVDEMDRRSLLRGSLAFGGAAAIAPGSLASFLDGIAPPATPATVGPGDVERVVSARRAFHDLDFAHGGGIAVEGGLAQLRWATRLLDSPCPESLQGQLWQSVGLMANTVGWAAFDAGRLDAATSTLQLGLACAGPSGDPSLRARVLTDLAAVETWAGRPQAAGQLLDEALAGDIAPTERALALSSLARTHAVRGDRQATLAAVGEADEAFASAGDGSRRELSWYTEASHLGATGEALHDLVLATGTGPDGADDRLAQAVAGYSTEFARSRLHDQMRLAVVHLVVGDPDEGAAVGLDALDRPAPIESARTGGYLRRLHHVSARHLGRPDVDELRSRTAEMLIA